MTKVNALEMRTISGTSGYKCSKCGRKFYTYVIQKTPWWLPDIKSKAIDQCNLHIMTSCRGAKAKWCW